MTNKYTLKDMYKWSIERDFDDSRDVALSVEYDLPNQEYVFITEIIYSPKPDNALVEIIKAMEKIKDEHPELFADYVNIPDVFSAALKRIETLDDIQLSDISMSTQAFAVSDDD